MKAIDSNPLQCFPWHRCGVFSLGFWLTIAPAVHAGDASWLSATAVPLPSSAMMGLLLIGALGAYARFPTHKRRRGRRR